MINRRALVVSGVLLLIASLAWAHDLFLKLDTYSLEPRTQIRIAMLIGTFSKSEGFLSPERLADVSVVSGGQRARLRADSGDPWT